MFNLFTKHPHSIGESYFQHLRFAFMFGVTMAWGGIACMLHAIFPFIFPKTASNILLKMTQDFVERMPVVDERVIVLSRTIEEKLNHL